MPNQLEQIAERIPKPLKHPVVIFGAGAVVLVLLIRGGSKRITATSDVYNNPMPDVDQYGGTLQGGSLGAISGLGMLPEFTLDGRGVTLEKGDERVEISEPQPQVPDWLALLNNIRSNFGERADVRLSLPGGDIDITTPDTQAGLYFGALPPEVPPHIISAPGVSLPDSSLPIEVPPHVNLPQGSPPSSITAPVTTAFRTLRDYLQSRDTSSDQTMFQGRSKDGQWTAQGRRYQDTGTHWITLDFGGPYVRYQPDKDSYRWGISTHDNAESSWNRVARWTEEIMGAHPELDPQKVMFYQLGRLKRNAETRGIPISSLGFGDMHTIPSANGKTELGI